MQWWPAGFALFAAALLPVQAALNGALNQALGRPALVVLISLTGSALFIGIVGLAPARWAWCRRPGWRTCRGGRGPSGVCGAIYLFSQPMVAHRLGAALYISLAVAGQVAAAMLLDHFGALNLPQHSASPLRIAGAGLIAAGVVLVARF